MKGVITTGVDLAKNALQVHGVAGHRTAELTLSEELDAYVVAHSGSGDESKSDDDAIRCRGLDALREHVAG